MAPRHIGPLSHGRDISIFIDNYADYLPEQRRSDTIAIFSSVNNLYTVLREVYRDIGAKEKV